MHRFSRFDRFSSAFSRHFSKVLAVSLLSFNLVPLAVNAPVRAVEGASTNLSEAKIESGSKTQVLPLPSANASVDPINSQYAIPWKVILEAQDTASRTGQVQSFRYRSALSIAPDQQTRAYSELNLTLHPNPSQSLVQSQLFIETEQQTYTLPATLHLEMGELSAHGLAGTFAVMIPAAWSADSQSLLLRQFEGLFGSDVASDYAMVWQKSNPGLQTYRPTDLDYDSATLMGWSQNRPGEILFQTRILGQANSQLVTVSPQNSGATLASPSDRPMQVTMQQPSPRMFHQTLK